MYLRAMSTLGPTLGRIFWLIISPNLLPYFKVLDLVKSKAILAPFIICPPAILVPFIINSVEGLTSGVITYQPFFIF